jgi:hypothetical protein
MTGGGVRCGRMPVFRTRDYMTQHDVHTYTVPMIRPLALALDIWKRYDIDFTV